MGGDRGCFWEPIYGGHTELRSSKDIKHNLVHDFKTKDKRGGSSQEHSVKDRNRYKESVYTGGLLPHKYPFCFIEEPSVFNRLRRTRRELVSKELGQPYDQP